MKPGFSTLEVLVAITISAVALILSFPALKADLTLLQRFRDDERESLKLESAARAVFSLYRESRSFSAVQSVAFSSSPLSIVSHPASGTACLSFLSLDVTQLANVEEVIERSETTIQIRATRRRTATPVDYENWLAISVDGFSSLKGTFREEPCFGCTGQDKVSGRFSASPGALFYPAISPPFYPMILVPIRASPVIYLDSNETLRRLDPLFRVNQPLVYGLKKFSGEVVYEANGLKIAEIRVRSGLAGAKERALRIPLSSPEFFMPADIVS